ncbi:MAG: TlpA disulfide reductase family protein [Moraxellaceae bacterium]|nr:TlpA disulfide reductase family protein [Moraxellaceae bacterium]MDZ4387803.1 TlpA disulfide reductase family protein [Moraxellaceae bacterium]
MRYYIQVLLLSLLPSTVMALPAGELAPNFTLPDSAGKSLSLSSLRGQFVYVDFWASWCGPCRQSFPWMNQLSLRTQNTSLKVVAINVDENRDDADAFLRKLPVNFTVLYDPAGKVASSYKLPGMPTSFLIGPDGRVRWMHIGFRKNDGQDIQAMILREMRKL